MIPTLSMNIRKLFIAAAIPVLFAAGAAHAETVRLRGEVTAVDGPQIVVKSIAGDTVTVKLTEKSRVLDVSKTSLDAIADKSYIGVAGVSAADGKVLALGVMVFPEAARGANEGSFPWDIRSASSMTNATVSRLVKKDGGAEIEVAYGAKTSTIQVDKATAFGTFVPGQRSLIVKGAKVVVFVDQDASGQPTAGAVMVGKDGFMPPI